MRWTHKTTSYLIFTGALLAVAWAIMSHFYDDFVRNQPPLDPPVEFIGPEL